MKHYKNGSIKIREIEKEIVNMPTFEYQCQDCNEQFEEFHSINHVIEECPKCQNKNVKKLISSGNFILTGSGWAKDSYSK